MKKHCLFTAGSMLLLLLFALASCVKEPITFGNQDNDSGTVEMQADWTEAFPQEEVPGVYYLCIDGWTVQQNEAHKSYVYDGLSEGRHTLLAYSLPEGIRISGTTATVQFSAAGRLEAMPGQLYVAHEQVDVSPGETTRSVLHMKGLLASLNLKLMLEDGAADELTHISAELNGVAQSVNLLTGEVGPENRILSMHATLVSTTRQPSSGSIVLSSRLVGVNLHEHQVLTLTLTLNDGHQEIITSDLTEKLQCLNDGVSDLELSGNVSLPQDGVFSGTIFDWIVTSSLDVDAQ